MLLGICCENCWDFLPKLLQQAYDVLLVVCGEMGIAQSHTNVLVSEQFFHCRQINPRHHQTTCKGMPQIVEGEIDQPGLLHCSLKRRAKRLVGCAVAATKHHTIY